MLALSLSEQQRDKVQPILLTSVKKRAKARNISVKDYMSGNLLHEEVKADDVAKGFLHLALSQKTTGAIITIDGGNIAASLR